eukprot:5794288-Pyramimonas_sp.AAC.1
MRCGRGLGESHREAAPRAGQIAEERRAAAKQINRPRVAVARYDEQLGHRRPVRAVGDGPRRVVRTGEPALH